MQAIKKFNELKSAKSRDLDKDLENIVELLKIQTSSLSNLTDKNECINLYEFKNDVLSILISITEKGSPIVNDTLIGLIADICIMEIPEVGADFSIQLEEIFKKIWKKCFKVLFFNGKIEKLPQIAQFLSEQEIPDYRNICLSLLFQIYTYKSYDLEMISNFSSVSVIYDVVKIYKNDIPKELKIKILLNLYRNLTDVQLNFKDEYLIKVCNSQNLFFKNRKCNFKQKEIGLLYMIFYEVNFLYFPGLISAPQDGVFSNEFVRFLHGLVVDKESSVQVFSVLKSSGVFLDLYEGLNNLYLNQIGSKQPVNPLDEKYLFIVLEVVVKILKFSWDNPTLRITLMMFCEVLMKYVVEEIDEQSKSIIYKYLDLYCQDTETLNMIIHFFKSKNYFTKQSLVNLFDKEISRKNINLISRLLKFVHNIDPKLAIEMSLYALRIEDPDTTESCFYIFNKLDYDISAYLNLSLNHIRRPMLKSTKLVNLILNYQISKKTPFEDVMFVNVMMSYSNDRFFEYAKLFKDFGKYMNENFLKRLVENVKDGLNFLNENCTKSTVKFIKNNEKWFNLFVKNNDEFFEIISNIYEKMLAQDKNIEMSFTEGLFLLEIPTESLFRILTKKLIFNLNKSTKKYITNIEYKLSKSILPSYCMYMKARIFIGDDVKTLIKYLSAVYENIEDLLGYYKIACGATSIIIEQIDDSSNFLLKYNQISKYEKIALLCKLSDEINSENENIICRIVKDEIIRLNMLQNKSLEDELIHKQCLLVLLKLSDIDSVVRLIDNYKDKDLLLKVNIRNVMTGGTFFNKKCIQEGSMSLQISAVVVLYFSNIGSVPLIQDWVTKLWIDSSDNVDLKIVVDDLYKRHDIEIY